LSLKNLKVWDGEYWWCVAEGDPSGNYKIDVYIGGILAESFSFEVGLKN